MPVALIVPQKKTIAVVGKSFVQGGGGGGGSGTVTSITAGIGLGAPSAGGIITTSGIFNLLAPSGPNIGGVKAGQSVTIDINGVLSILPPTASVIGGVKADGVTTTIAADGTITAIGGGGGGGGTPGGQNTQIQFNNSGAFGGSPSLTWNGTQLGVNVVSSAQAQALSLRSDTGVRIADNSANFISMTGNSTGNSPTLSTQGSDANINLVIYGKGTGGIQIGTLANATPLIAGDASTPTLLTPGASGQVLTSAGAGKSPYWATPSSGGGGVGFTVTAVWTGGTSNKNAYLGAFVNVVGITLSLVANSGSGSITSCIVLLNNVSIGQTYTSTGTFPNYTITIPSAHLTSNAAETAAVVNISIQGIFSGLNFFLSNIAQLTNNQPVPFATTLTLSYDITTAPYYQTETTLRWSYSNSSQITSFGGFVTIAGVVRLLNCTSPTGDFGLLPIIGGTIGGSAIGNGLNGAGSSTVSFTGGSFPAVPTYVPAFYTQNTSSTPPIFTTIFTQTPTAAVGSTITYPIATSSTQYNWVCTQRPLANLTLQTMIGSSTLVPDVTGTPQVIAGQTFNVYGWTNLGVGTRSILVIS